MKKLLVISMLALSASAFAYGGQHHYTRITSDDGTRTICTVRTSGRMDGRHSKMMRNMPSDMKLALEKMKLEISQRKLNVKKLLLEDPVNWKKVEQENEQMGILQGRMKTEIQKYMMTAAPEDRPIHHNNPKPMPMPKTAPNPAPAM